jgi:hypothetical protein
VHQENIHTILDYPTPRSLTDLGGFFRICNYYRYFVKGFSQLDAPLTDLTKKGMFRWSKHTHVAFKIMKKTMRTFLVLALPDFTQPFVLECDTSSKEIKVLLMQNQHSIAFESRNLMDLEKLYLIYDKDILAIMHALAKFK